MFENPHEILDGFESLRRHHFAKQALRESQLTRIPLKQNARVLDIAIGPGLYLEFWLRYSEKTGAHFTLLEHNADALAVCRLEAAKVGAEHRLSTVQGDLFKLSEKLQGPFDVIFIGNTLEYISEPVAYLREQVLPLLAPGGTLAIRDMDCGFVNCNLVDPALNNRMVGSRIRNCQVSKMYHNPFMGRDLGRILSEAGFKNVKLTPDLAEFKSPLSQAEALYVSKIHTAWYTEDTLGILSDEDKATWAQLFALDNEQGVLYAPHFYYAEMEYFVMGTKA